MIKIIGSKADRDKLKAARRNLQRVSDEEVRKNGGQPISDDNERYRKANKAVLDAERNVPFLGRW
ncbi:hypothetical protein [Thermoactinospora rubra]|uniref:hypothetical protein n=1 Tax=Thermoactinospora rubra TaxID=1088767 RepID=UPI000A1201E4|nr:hypothetical protein [Thermoactinospora rubra]